MRPGAKSRKPKKVVWTLGLERINCTKTQKTIRTQNVTITDSLALVAESELGQKENKCWEKAVTGHPEGEGGDDLFCRDKALVLITTGTTRVHSVQSIWGVPRCLVEQIVLFNMDLMSFFGIANVIMALNTGSFTSARGEKFDLEKMENKESKGTFFAAETKYPLKPEWFAFPSLCVLSLCSYIFLAAWWAGVGAH